MGGKAIEGWWKAGIEAWMLGVEASMVMGQRWAKLAAGGTAAAREAELMVAEKVRAGLELQMQLASRPTTPLDGTRRALRHYRRKVAANRRRLSR